MLFVSSFVDIEDEEDEEEEFVVQKIVDSRLVKGKTEYLVKWTGYHE